LPAWQSKPAPPPRADEFRHHAGFPDDDLLFLLIEFRSAEGFRDAARRRIERDHGDRRVMRLQQAFQREVRRVSADGRQVLELAGLMAPLGATLFFGVQQSFEKQQHDEVHAGCTRSLRKLKERASGGQKIDKYRRLTDPAGEERIERYVIRRHFGDNPLSDRDVPQKIGIDL
jgi:hypothetical protein